jgi:8-amino-7-oxononanoate synthase
MSDRDDSVGSMYEPPPPSDDLLAKTRAFLPRLTAIQDRGGYSYRRTLTSASRNRVTVLDQETGQPREMLMFASNNYLGLATHPRVVAAAMKACEHYGYGTGSVALLSGTTDLHRRLEDRIAAFYGCERAVVFPTGYQANVGTLQALLLANDVALTDLYAHASLIDGVKLSDGTLKYYQHNDMAHLERQLERSPRFFRGRMIVTDGVFSMDGDVAPLDAIVALARSYGAAVAVDEAHALGMIGAGGRGTAERFGLTGRVDLTLGTLSKAPSAIGGYLAGTAEVVEYVRHFARSYIFSTSLPVPVVAGLIEVFEIIEHDHELRARLHRNIDHLRAGFARLGLHTFNSCTAIIPVLIADEGILRRVCADLQARGFLATPVTFPAVAKGRSRIRFSVMASHTLEELDQLLNAMADLTRQYDLAVSSS